MDLTSRHWINFFLQIACFHFKNGVLGYLSVPEQIHISYGDKPTEMIIMWATRRPPVRLSTVLYYHEASLMSGKQVASRWVEFIKGNENGTYYQHRAKLTDLIPDNRYFYSVKVDDYRTEMFLFNTQPDTTIWSKKILIFGVGSKSDNFDSLKQLTQSDNFSAVVHVGDLSDDSLHGGKVFDDFMNKIQPIVAQLPYMTCPGEDDDEFINYRTRLSMPHTDWPMPPDKLWYSFDLGKVHFISFSTEVYFGGIYIYEQREWIIADLEKANTSRHIRPWIIAYGHRPLYCSSTGHTDCRLDDEILRAGFEDIFYKYAVDVVIAGHQHGYERTKPVYKNYVVNSNYTNPGAPIYFTTSSVGDRNDFSGFSTVAEDWLAFRDNSTLSVGVLQVFNDSHLNWIQVALNGTAIDNVWVTQFKHGLFPKDLVPWRLLHGLDFLMYGSISVVCLVIIVLVSGMMVKIRYRNHHMQEGKDKEQVTPLLTEDDTTIYEENDDDYDDIEDKKVDLNTLFEECEEGLAMRDREFTAAK